MLAWRSCSCAAVSPKRAVDLRTEFFAQRVQRVAHGEAVRAKPCEQRVEVSVTAIMIVGRGARELGAPVTLDDEFAIAPRVIAAKDLDEFGVDEHVALAAVRLRAKELGRLDADQALVEAKR